MINCSHKNCKTDNPQPQENFYKDNSSRGFYAYCKICTRERLRLYKLKYPEKIKLWNKTARNKRREEVIKYCSDHYYKNKDEYRGNRLRRYFGKHLTWKEAILEYEKMVINQNNLCAICDKPERKLDYKGQNILKLSVDHDHVTGKVRGLLCSKCNTTLGLVGDTEESLIKFMNYFKKNLKS